MVFRPPVLFCDIDLIFPWTYNAVLLIIAFSFFIFGGPKTNPRTSHLQVKHFTPVLDHSSTQGPYALLLEIFVSEWEKIAQCKGLRMQFCSGSAVLGTSGAILMVLEDPRNTPGDARGQVVQEN